MKLDRLTSRTLFEIRSPMWLGGSTKRMVGLDLTRISKHNEIIFTYVRKSDGRKSIPDHFYFDGDRRKTEKFKTMMRGNTKLLLIELNTLPKLEIAEPSVKDLESLSTEEIEEKYPVIYEVFFKPLPTQTNIFKETT